MPSLRLVSLTAHERDILHKYASGVRGQQLANELKITYNTTRTHYLRICRKIDVADMMQASITYIQECHASAGVRLSSAEGSANEAS